MKIMLPTGRPTTRLGFGCAFPRSVSRQGAAVLLDAAFDAGIRHFDVAPSYAEGAAEEVLAEFLRKHDDGITVTTKYGLLPPTMRARHVRMVRAALRPALEWLRRVPALAKGLARSAAALNVSSKAAFSASEAKLSLARSLTELRLGRVDIFLMHEPTATDLNDDLLEFLRQAVASELIGCFGIGGEASRGPGLYAKRRPFCDVMQYDWSALSPPFAYPGSLRVLHSVFSRQLRRVHQALGRRPDIRERWSARTGVNLGDLRTLADVTLKAALARHPDSIVLFTSSKPQNIFRNVSVAEDLKLETNALQLCELIEQQGAEFPVPSRRDARLPGPCEGVRQDDRRAGLGDSRN
jgi:aryl-alcohol dehydrogenase-like predicted oxidoreductase